MGANIFELGVRMKTLRFKTLSVFWAFHVSSLVTLICEPLGPFGSLSPCSFPLTRASPIPLFFYLSLPSLSKLSSSALDSLILSSNQPSPRVPHTTSTTSIRTPPPPLPPWVKPRTHKEQGTPQTPYPFLCTITNR